MGFIIGLRCLNFVTKELEIDISNRILWTDSQCVLKWISSTKPLPPFINNRVKEIRSSKDVKFRFIEGVQNPADIPTRGSTFLKLQSNMLWWHGPKWLQTPKISWPSWDVPEIDENILESTSKNHSHNNIFYETSFMIQEESQSILAPLGISEVNFSTLQRLIRVTAWGMRFLDKLRGRNQCSDSLTCHEISRAKFKWELHVQRKNFGQIIHSIQNSKRNNLKDQLGLING